MFVNEGMPYLPGGGGGGGYSPCNWVRVCSWIFVNRTLDYTRFISIFGKSWQLYDPSVYENCWNSANPEYKLVNGNVYIHLTYIFISIIDLPCALYSLICAWASLCMEGHTISFSFCSLAGSENTLGPRTTLLMVPSSATTSNIMAFKKRERKDKVNVLWMDRIMDFYNFICTHFLQKINIFVV